MIDAVRVTPEVEAALADGRPVVALESTIVSFGLPRPDNLRIAGEIEAAVRARGAVPATVAVIDGVVRIGLDPAALELLATSDDVAKTSTRDLAFVMERKGHGATTVAATATLAKRAGIRVFATGGLGGVHRVAYDESADLVALSRLSMVIVCSGVKSILDVPATLERLETLGVPVVGIGTDCFPGFYLHDSGQPAPWRSDSAAEVARLLRVRDELGLAGSIVAALPVPADAEVSRELHDRLLAEGLALAAEHGVTGKEVTPFLLAHLHAASHGATLRANVRLVLNNASFAADVACELAGGAG